LCGNEAALTCVAQPHGLQGGEDHIGCHGHWTRPFPHDVPLIDENPHPAQNSGSLQRYEIRSARNPDAVLIPCLVDTTRDTHYTRP
jgi:hypothetical protein